MNAHRYLILGNGAAGVTAAEEIRTRDPHGHITIVSAEPYPMYSRPGLAYVIINEVSDQQVIARRPEWYAQHRIGVVQGKAAHVDTITRQVRLEDGGLLAYDRLLIATGARAVSLPNPGAHLDGVVYLDTLDGAKELLIKTKSAKRAVVAGGGITALEMAEGLAHHGVDTHYLVRKKGLWSAVLNDTESALLEQRVIGHGVTVHYNTEIAGILDDGAGRVAGVKFTNGETFACELVGAAIGVKPVIEFVAGSAIKTDRGLLVNEYLETNVPDVYAAGDCAQVWDRWSKKHLLDILWPTAIAAGSVAGANMTGAHDAYLKGTPFNVCLLFGLHITACGQLGGTRDSAEAEVLQHVDRGTSEVWATNPHNYASAWAQDGANTVRLVLDGDVLAGALVVGKQTLADPLRDLIEHQVNVADLRPYMRTGGPVMNDMIEQFWRRRQVAQAARKTGPLKLQFAK